MTRTLKVGIYCLSMVWAFCAYAQTNCASRVMAAERHFRGTKYTPRNKSTGMRLLEPCLQSGSHEAQRLMAYLLLGSYGHYERDDTRAFNLMMRSAEQGNMHACNSIGEMYQRGVGVPIDFVKAREWYETAIRIGSDQAAYNLGYLYYKGLGGVEQSYSEAIKWLQRSAYPPARQLLAICHYFGYGVPQNKERGLSILETEPASPEFWVLYHHLKDNDTLGIKIPSAVPLAPPFGGSADVKGIVNAGKQLLKQNRIRRDGLAGRWKGKIVELDYAEEKILRSYDVKLSFTYDSTKNQYRYDYTQNGQTIRNIATFVGDEVYLNGLNIEFDRIYRDLEDGPYIPYRFSTSRWARINVGPHTFLGACLDSEVAGVGEPGPPFKLILTRDNAAAKTLLSDEVVHALEKQVEGRKDDFIQLYPNTFQEELQIQYTLAEPSDIRVELYDTTGRPARSVAVEKNQPAGRHRYQFDGSGLSTGLYIVRVTVGNQVHTKLVVKE